MTGDPGLGIGLPLQPPPLDTSKDIGKESSALSELVALKLKMREMEAQERKLRVKAIDEAIHLLANAGEEKGIVFTSSIGSIVFKRVQSRVKPEDHPDLFYHHELMGKARDEWMHLHKEKFDGLREAMDKLMEAHDALGRQWDNLISECSDYTYHKQQYDELVQQMGGLTPQLQVNLVR